jgi:hypothetical protein
MRRMFQPAGTIAGLSKATSDMPSDEAKEEKPERQDDQQLARDISTLSVFAERLRIREYVQLLQRPWRLAGVYFLTGMARGAGVTIGTIIVLALLTYFLSTIVTLPVIGKYLAGIVQEVRSQLPPR